ncbi:MAG: protein MraZ [Candidatus Cloacimonetes bacterium]|nr:protein MraZ [Candidatus Cloacimonadota bacterium]
MSGDFLGIYENSVHKMRVVIPAVLKNKFSAAAKETVICTLGPNNSVAIYPLDNWNALKEKLNKGDERSRTLLNNLIDFACLEQKLEGPGRIRIGDELLKTAGIVDSVIIKGDGSYITLWNPDTFRAIREERKQIHNKEYTPMDYKI